MGRGGNQRLRYGTEGKQQGKRHLCTRIDHHEVPPLMEHGGTEKAVGKSVSLGRGHQRA